MISRRIIAAVLQRSNLISLQSRAIAAQTASVTKDSSDSKEAWNKTKDAAEDAAQKIKGSAKQKWDDLKDESKGKAATEIKDGAKQKRGDVQSSLSGSKDKNSDRYQPSPWSNSAGSSAPVSSSYAAKSSGSDNRSQQQQRDGYDKSANASKSDQWQQESVEGDRKWQGQSQSQGRNYSEKDSAESGRAYSDKSHRPAAKYDESQYGSCKPEERGSDQRSGPSSWGGQQQDSWRNNQSNNMGQQQQGDRSSRNDQNSDWGYSRGPQGYDQNRRQNNPNQSWGPVGLSSQYNESYGSSGTSSPYNPTQNWGSSGNSDFGQHGSYRQRQSNGFPNYGQSVGGAGENWGSAQAGYGQGWESQQSRGQGQDWTSATGVPQYGYSHGRPSQNYENQPRGNYGQQSYGGSQNWNTSSYQQPKHQRSQYGSQGRTDNFGGNPADRWEHEGDYQYGSTSAPENWYSDGARGQYSDGQGRYNELANRPWEKHSSNRYADSNNQFQDGSSGGQSDRWNSESGPKQSRYGTSSRLESSGQSGQAGSSSRYGDNQSPSEYQKQQESLPPVGGHGDGQYFGSGTDGGNRYSGSRRHGSDDGNQYGGAPSRSSRDDFQGSNSQRGRSNESDWKGDWKRNDSQNLSENNERDHDSLSGKIKDKVEGVVEKVEGMASSAWEKLGGSSKDEKDRK